MIIAVLAGALHYGRNGGFVAAVMATGLYVALRMPLLNETGLTTDALILIGNRVLTYGIIGIVGGEAATRVKYLMAALDGGTMIDPVTGSYTAAHAGASIASALAAYERYETPFSLIVLQLARTLWTGLNEPRYRALMRQTATALRGSIRLVDDLAFRPEAEFLVLLPHTDLDGARVAEQRLRTLVDSLHETQGAAITTEVLSCSRDAARLAALASELAPEHANAVVSRLASAGATDASVAADRPAPEA
jgi:GGDEF domain-containing protein